MLVEVQYYCPTCNVKFVVYHNAHSKQRNIFCNWCNGAVNLTGQIRQDEKNEIVTYMHGIEISREPRRIE